MRVSRLRDVRAVRFVPTFGDNRSDPKPFAVWHLPLRREWRLRYAESMASITDSEKVDGWAGIADRYRVAFATSDGFLAEFLAVHVTQVDDLYSDEAESVPMTLDEAIALFVEVPDLGFEIVAHLMGAGTVSEADAGN